MLSLKRGCFCRFSSSTSTSPFVSLASRENAYFLLSSKGPMCLTHPVQAPSKTLSLVFSGRNTNNTARIHFLVASVFQRDKLPKRHSYFLRMSNSGLPRRKSPKGQCLAAPLPIINHRQHLLKRGKSSARPAAGLSGFGPVQDKGRQPKQPFRCKGAAVSAWR